MDRGPHTERGTSETIEMRDAKNEKVSSDSRARERERERERRLREIAHDATGGLDRMMRLQADAGDHADDDEGKTNTEMRVRETNLL